MSLNTSKMILKVFGIISIVFGVLGIMAGIAAIAGGALVGAGAATSGVSEAQEATKIAGGVAVLGLGGLLIIIVSVVELLSGIFSVRASNDISKIMPAWVFALIGFILNIPSIATTIITAVQSPNGQMQNVISGIIGFAISILIFVAATNVKKAAGK